MNTPPKRLARRLPDDGNADSLPVISKSTSKPELKSESPKAKKKDLAKTVEIASDLYITPYSPKSFIVMGSTLDHTQALVALGGKYTQLKIGNSWLFAKIREDSVRKYIETGEIAPYVYSADDRQRFEQKSPPASTENDACAKLAQVFRELRLAFDEAEEYTGDCVIDVIEQFEIKYLKQK